MSAAKSLPFYRWGAAGRAQSALWRRAKDCKIAVAIGAGLPAARHEAHQLTEAIQANRECTDMGTTPSGMAIVTYARGWQSLAALRSLGRRGIQVITADEVGLTPASLSKYSTGNFLYPDCTKEPEGFLDKLEIEILKPKPEDPATPYVLMPIHKETYLIARHRERFEPHIELPLPSIGQIEAVHKQAPWPPIRRNMVSVHHQYFSQKQRRTSSAT